MPDHSHLDQKYFIGDDVYNCPFCNRRNVRYHVQSTFSFDWTDKKKCFVFLAQCSSCGNTSMHLSFTQIFEYAGGRSANGYRLTFTGDIDSRIFYSVPTTFFTLDDRIPEIIRELITEAGGCLKMNYLTGASACMRKAIYELLVKEKAVGPDYESRIKSLKTKYPESDPSLFDILAHIQDMTSDKIHEQSWDRWNSQNLRLIIETLRTVLHEIYVLPKERADRSRYIQQLREDLLKDKKESS